MTTPSRIARDAEQYRQIVWWLTAASHAARRRGGTLVLELHEVRTGGSTLGFRLSHDIVGGERFYEA
jgi:hypothetical protein